jgi:PAS domain S-box-containing protein
MDPKRPHPELLGDVPRLHKTAAANVVLTRGAVRQQKAAEAAEHLNGQLKVEIAAREKTALDLAEKARLLDLTDDAIIVRDVEGVISYWNHGAEVLYGWSREEALGKTSHGLLQTESRTPLEQITEELHRNGRWTGEFVHTRRDGKRITVLARKTLDRDQQGLPAAVLQTLTDISERKRMEEILRRSEELTAASSSAARTVSKCSISREICFPWRVGRNSWASKTSALS